MPGESSGARCGDKRKDDRDFLPSFMWCHQESNRGHKDFQSFALPTELWHLALDCECKVIAFCRIHQIFSQLFFKKINNCDKMVVRDGCGGYKGRTFGTHSLIYPQSRHPACRHAPRMAQPNIPGGVVARLRTTSGVRFCWGISFPACRHGPAWRNTGLRTAAIPCRGLRLPRLSTAPLHCAASKRVPPQEGAKKACTGARLSYEKNLLIMNCYLIVLIALVVPSVKVVTTMFTPSNGLSERCPIMLTYSTDLTSFSTASSLNVPSTPVPSCVPKR